MEPRIAELLVRGGIVTREQLDKALESEKKNGANLSQELVRLGFTTEHHLNAFDAELFGEEFGEMMFSCKPKAHEFLGKVCSILFLTFQGFVELLSGDNPTPDQKFSYSRFHMKTLCNAYIILEMTLFVNFYPDHNL